MEYREEHKLCSSMERMKSTDSHTLRFKESDCSLLRLDLAVV